MAEWTVPAALTLAVGFLVLIVAERFVHRPAMFVGKAVAGLGFTALAVARGAPGGSYADWVLVGLAFGWAADLFLVPASQVAFRVAIVLFLAGQLAYTVAFALSGLEPVWTGAAALVLGGVGVLVGRPIVRRAPSPLRPAVVAYIVAISVMVAAGVGALGRGVWAGAVAAAVLFYVSDLTVALHRFFAPRYVYRLVGLPLYYAAQALFAWSVARVP